MKTLQEELKKQMGRELQKHRLQKRIHIKSISELSNLHIEQIDNVELQNPRAWHAYHKMLKVYGKKVEVKLVDA